MENSGVALMEIELGKLGFWRSGAPVFHSAVSLSSMRRNHVSRLLRPLQFEI